MAQKGVEEEGQRPDEDCDGIEDSRYIHGKDGHYEERKEQVVLEGPFQKPDGSGFGDPLCYEIDQGSKGADPAAEEPPQDQC